MSANAANGISAQFNLQLEQASQLLQQGQIQPAAQLCQNILAQDETCAPAYSIMGDILRRMGNYTSAEKFLDLALKFDEHNPAYRIQKSQALYSQERAREALAEIDAVIARFPQHAVAHLLRGDYLITLKRYDDALSAFDKVGELDDMPGLGEHYGLCYMEMGKLPQAETHFKDVTEKMPDYFRPYQLIGQTLLEREEYEEAEKYFDLALARNPNDYQAWSGKGTVARHRKDEAQALACFQRSVQCNPGFYHPHYVLGSYLQQSKRFAEAERFLRQAVALRPSFIPAQQELANNLYNTGRREEALAHIEAVLKEDPANVSFGHMRAGIIGETPENAPAGYVSELFDGYAESFDEHLVGGLGYKTPAVMAEALARLIQASGDGRHDLAMMDLGCGTGLGAEAYRALTGWREGVDLSEKMVEKARSKELYDALHVGDVVAQLEAAQRSYDVITACDVLVYIGNLEPLFKAASAKLSADGYFTVSVENGDAFAPFALRPTGRYVHAASYLEELAARYGLQLRLKELTAIRTENYEPVEGYIFIFQK